MKENKKILIIDDDKNMRELLEMEFSDLGYETVVAEDAFMGLQVLRDKKVDLVILDIKMPGMDGIEALERIVAIQRNLPVVIHSAYSHYKENYLTWSAAAYVVKSGNLDELIQTVNELTLN